MAEIIQFRDYQKPVQQGPCLLAQATSLVEFINGLTAKDEPKVYPDFSVAGAFHTPDGDCA